MGRYGLLRVLSRGRRSWVYEARCERRGGPVALKVFALGYGPDGTPRPSFRQEAALAALVRHPAILPVLESGEADSCGFLALKLEGGRTLADVASQAQDARGEAFFVGLAARFALLVRGIARLHALGIVHRDLNPSNVLVDSAGGFVVTDFGSALHRGQGLEKCVGPSDAVAPYSSPEQLLPGADPLDPRGDVYALGALLYEAATGRCPFPPHGRHALARLKLTRDPPPPRCLSDHVPLAVDAAVRQAMHSDPAQRLRGAAELAGELERFAARREAARR
jgi:serine/threonine-protein kinase